MVSRKAALGPLEARLGFGKKMFGFPHKMKSLNTNQYF